MKKKIVKRSLALGALMAFVITGSAMAADLNLSANGGGNVGVVNDVDYTDSGYENITLTNTNGHGLGTGNNTIVASNSINITSNGSDKCGIFGYGNNTINAKYITITADEDAIFIPHEEEHKTKIEGFDLLTIKATNGYAIVNNAISTNVNSLIIKGNEGSVMNLESSGKPAIGSRSDGSVTVVEVGTLNITGNGGNKYNGLIWSEKDATINITVDNLNVEDTGSGGNAINLQDGTLNLTVNKTTVIDGDVNVSKGTLKASFDGSTSYLTGTVKTTGDGVTNLTFSEGATWDVVAPSTVSNLTVDNANIKVNSLAEEQVVATNANIKEATLIGSSKVADQIADGQASWNDLLATMSTNDGITTVATEEGNITGAMSADVVREENGNIKKDEDGNVVLTNKQTAVNITNASLADNAVALKAHWRTHMNDMNKRMGELRNATGEHGVWVRMVRGENEYDNNKAQYNQYQLGYDEKLSTDKRWTVGAAVTFAEGDSNYGKGTTEDDSTAFAIYGSKLNNDGTFVDLIARYARMESDITSNEGDMGDYSTNGYSVSAEFGKRIQQGKGLWIEPQFELTYGTVDSAEYVIGNKKVHLDSMDSFIARAGFAIGKDIKQGNVYARASYLYDFDGEADSYVTAASGGSAVSPHEDDLGGGWWEVGVGANINLSDATYIYADVEKTFGGEVDTNWQWNLGVRYSF